MMQKKEKTAKFVKTKPKKSNRSLFLAKVLLYSLCIIGVALQASNRIIAAQSLIGTTSTTVNSLNRDKVDGDDSLSNAYAVMMSGEYRYIPVETLEKMSNEDLAYWYVSQFPDDGIYNEIAKAEFDNWLVDEEFAGTRDSATFEEALNYAKANPKIELVEQTTDEQLEGQEDTDSAEEETAEDVDAAKEETVTQETTTTTTSTTTTTTTTTTTSPTQKQNGDKQGQTEQQSQQDQPSSDSSPSDVESSTNNAIPQAQEQNP